MQLAIIHCRILLPELIVSSIWPEKLGGLCGDDTHFYCKVKDYHKFLSDKYEVNWENRLAFVVLRNINSSLKQHFRQNGKVRLLIGMSLIMFIILTRDLYKRYSLQKFSLRLEYVSCLHFMMALF